MNPSGTTDRLLPAAAIISVFLMALIKIGDYDIFYHLKAGELIVKTGRILRNDPFSFATGNLPWPVHSWLSQVVLYLVHSLAGFNGLVVMNALILSLTFSLLYLTMRLWSRDRTGFVFAAVIIVLSALALRFRMWVRPHTFEFLFIASYIYLINLYRVKGSKALCVLPLLQILWVNMHGSHLIGLVIPLIYIAGAFVDTFIGKEDTSYNTGRKGFIRAVAAVLVLNALSGLINPETYKALVLPVTALSPGMQEINEFQPLSIGLLTGYGIRYTWAFTVMATLALAGFAYRGRKTEAADVFLFAAFLVLAVKGIRFIGEFSIVAAPIVHKNLNPAFERLFRKRASIAGASALILIVALVIPLSVMSRTYSFGIGIKQNIFPERAVDFIEGAGIGGRVFNSFAFGDYLIWRTFPRRKVLIHGHNRSEVFPQRFYKQYVKAHTSPEVWKRLVDRYNITYTLLEYYLTDYGGKERVTHLAHNPRWFPVYWDGLAIVYVKDVPANRDVLAKYGLRYIRPTYLDFSYLDRYIRSGLSDAVLSELDRLIALSPENEEAFLARAYVHFRLGPSGYKQAEADVKRAIEINPERAMSHSALGLLYLKRDYLDGARREFERALSLDPNDPGAKSGLRDVKRRSKG